MVIAVVVELGSVLPESDVVILRSSHIGLVTSIMVVISGSMVVTSVVLEVIGSSPSVVN